MSQRAQTKSVAILGTHGVPANYGGFETAAEAVALYLISRDWDVTVYCQETGRGPIVVDSWNGIRRVKVPVSRTGWLGTATFDAKSIWHACRSKVAVHLTFGYNTGIFNFVQVVRRIPNVINMDGMEWARKRWGLTRQTILYVNERFAALFGSLLIADHPAIAKYLLSRVPARKIRTIAYGAYPADDIKGQSGVQSLGLDDGPYCILVARPIPENSILEIVRTFSKRQRHAKLVVVGSYGNDGYEGLVRRAASSEVIFVGVIYDRQLLGALRAKSLAYFHGHTVGGTNPSLVEALAARNPVIANDNVYNRWVAGGAALFFSDESELDAQISRLINEPSLRERLSRAAWDRYASAFTWAHIGRLYEEVLIEAAAQSGRTV